MVLLTSHPTFLPARTAIGRYPKTVDRIVQGEAKDQRF